MVCIEGSCGPSGVSINFTRITEAYAEGAVKRLQGSALGITKSADCFGVVKGDTKLKVFHSMVKYNDMFDTNNLSDSVI